MPSSRWISSSQRRRSWRTRASSAPKGSSSSKTFGTRRQGACQSDALALTSRELLRVAVRERSQLHELEELVRRVCCCAALRLFTDRESERDVLAHGHVTEQRVVLEHHADAALLHAAIRLLLAADPDPPSVGRSRPGDHPQHRALARAARAEQRGDLALLRLERHVVDGLELPNAFRQCSATIASCWLMSPSSREALS